MFDIDYILLFFVGVLCSILGGASFGGGNLIATPMLLAYGFPAGLVISTVRMGVIGASISAIFSFFKKKNIKWNFTILLSIISMTSSFIGANIIISLNPELLKKIIGIFVILGLLLMITKKDCGLKEIKTSKIKIYIGYVLFFIIKILGPFGMGVGVLINYVFIFLFGMTAIDSNANSRLPNILDSFVSMSIFVISGMFEIKMMIIYFFATIIGGLIGAKLAIKKGNKFIKNIILILITISLIKIFLF